MTPGHFPALVLFDLDGTLLDSAPDFVATVNALRTANGQPAMAAEALRPHVSKGARAMLAAAFPQFDAAARDAMVPGFLEVYERELARHGAPFAGIEALLDAIEASGSRWGIVTNKPEYLARQLLPLLGWDQRCAVLVGGDTLPVRKPDPLPLQHAAQVCGVAVADCAYVGDDERDIVAARAAGMHSVVALWGYRLDGDDPKAWQGDRMIESPTDLLEPDAWQMPGMGGRSADLAMADPQALASFLDKWTTRWPEWGIAEVFVPTTQRATATAWFALRQELTDAAWGTSDPRPGEAKLAWWLEELQGWAQGRRRHPLGTVLRGSPVPWTLLATCLPALLASRERATDIDHAIAALEPFAEGVAGIAVTLFGGETPAPAASVVIGLLAEQLLLQGDAAVPLQIRARLGEGLAEHAAARAWAGELLQRWPAPHDGSVPGRIHAALLRERLRRFAGGGNALAPSRWRVLWTAWRAARG
jgi:phosphoglycolate phosphatase